MARGGTAKKYARAYFELCGLKAAEVVQGGLREISECWISDQALREALSNPGYSLKERGAVLREIADRFRPSDEMFCNFCSVLLENGRLDLLPAIAGVFAELVEEARNLLAFEIISARPLSENDRNEIKGELERDLGSLTSLAWSVDESILGGLLVKMGDRLLDSSVRGSLEKIRANLTG